MPDFSIRRAMPGDEAQIFTLLTELAAYEKLQDHFTLTPAAIARDFFVDHPVVFCDLAFQGDEPVGLTTWYWSYATFRAQRCLYVEDLYVRPAFRKRGYGKMLLAHLARVALAANAHRLEWRVLDWNTPSIAFYDGIGGKPFPGWLGYRLEGDAMKKLGGT